MEYVNDMGSPMILCLFWLGAAFLFCFIFSYPVLRTAELDTV